MLTLCHRRCGFAAYCRLKVPAQIVELIESWSRFGVRVACAEAVSREWSQWQCLCLKASSCLVVSSTAHVERNMRFLYRKWGRLMLGIGHAARCRRRSEIEYRTIGNNEKRRTLTVLIGSSDVEFGLFHVDQSVEGCSADCDASRIV